MKNVVPEGATVEEFKGFAFARGLTFSSSVELQTAHAVANWKDLQYRQATPLAMRTAESERGNIYVVVLPDEIGGMTILGSEIGEHTLAHAEARLAKHLVYGYDAKLARIEIIS